MPQTPRQAAAFLVGLALALWLLTPFWGPAAEAERQLQGAPFGGLEGALFESVNTTRARAHRVPLARTRALDDVARAHSRDMARRRYLSHTSPEGKNPVDRIVDGGVVGFSLAAENIGMTDRGDPNREILEGWIASAVHRKNLLAPAFNTTGIGVAAASDGTLYYTQLYTSEPRAESDSKTAP